MLEELVKVANKNLYNLANSVQRYHIQDSLLNSVSFSARTCDTVADGPPHKSLNGFDLGDDNVEVILRDDFYESVLNDLGKA